VAHHSNDALTIYASSNLSDDLGGSSGIPAGAVNRIVNPYTSSVIQNRGYWSVSVDGLFSASSNSYLQNNGLTPQTIGGLRLESSVSGSTGNVMVEFGFTDNPGNDVYLSVFLLEDKVTGYSQSNYYNDDSSSDYYGLGNPIVGFEHNHVLRKVVTPLSGDLVFSGGETETVYSVDYSFSLESAWKVSELSVLVMLHYSGSGSGDHVVLNVQKTSLGETHDWD